MPRSVDQGWKNVVQGQKREKEDPDLKNEDPNERGPGLAAETLLAPEVVFTKNYGINCKKIRINSEI